jgi:hypothetical protein
MNKKRMRSFRLEDWMFEGMSEVSRRKGLKHSEWLRKLISRALADEGYTQSTWAENEAQKRAQGHINEYHNPNGQSDN